MKHLYPYLRRFRKESILAPLFKMLEATFDLLVPMVVADIIKVGIANGDTTYIWTRCGLLVLMALIGLLCSFTAQYFAARAAIGTSTGLRHELMAHIQSLSFSELDTLGVSTLITRMTSDVNQVQNGLNMFLRLFLRSPFIVAGAMIAAFTIDTQIALIFLAAIPVLAVIVFGIMRITSPMYKTVQSRLDAVMGATRENLSGVRVVRAFGREDAEEENFVQQNGSLNAMQLKVGRIAALMNPLTYVVVNLGIIGILYFGANKIGSGALLSGDVVALVNYMSQILVELVKLANLVVLLTRAIASMGRVSQELDTPYQAAKRTLDIVASALGLVILSPLMLGAALAVKLQDGGPVFYRQVRLTRGGKRFYLTKFRSMIVNAESATGAVLAGKSDPRITKVGEFLRATRMDELPQLWNILKGDMTLVGPRPERPEFYEKICAEYPEFDYRLKVKAGLTGYAQLYGKYNTTFEDKARLDMYYIQHASFFWDIQLLFYTLKIIFIRESTEGVEEKKPQSEEKTPAAAGKTE